MSFSCAKRRVEMSLAKKTIEADDRVIDAIMRPPDSLRERPCLEILLVGWAGGVPDDLLSDIDREITVSRAQREGQYWVADLVLW